MANVATHSLTLNSPCFVIRGLGTKLPLVRDHKLADFAEFIEQVSYTNGQGPRIMADEVDGVWCAVDRNNRDPETRFFREFESEEEAKAAVESMHISDILNNSEITIYTDRSQAVEDLMACITGRWKS